MHPAWCALSLLAVTRGAILTWLPVREWVRPIPGTNIDKYALRTFNGHDTVDASFQSNKITNPHANLQASIDLDEVIIQFNQHQALNIWPETIPPPPYRLHPLLTHLSHCFTQLYHSHTCDCDGRDTETAQPSNDRPSHIHPASKSPCDPIEARLSTPTLTYHQPTSPNPSTHQHHCDAARSTEGTISANHITGSYPSPSGAFTIPFFSYLDASKSSFLQWCVDHTSSSQGQHAIAMRTTMQYRAHSQSH